MEQYKYDFSVVMAVYNVENYLREAVDSLIHQTIGFDRIQLILVDDGSTDCSGVICDEYGAKFPNNVIVIHKENGRQASARNAGLKHLQGRYVNFMDPDDTMERTAFEKVYYFYQAHRDETDICCIPMFYFGEQQGPHILNNKFEQGTRVIDLTQEKEAHYILLSSSASFYTNAAARIIRFDTQLYQAEDAKVNMDILLENPKIGVVTDTRYNYRKHGGSTVDKTRFVRRAYTEDVKAFLVWALEEAKRRFDHIPLFVQYTVMYYLQWKMGQDHIPTGVLSSQEEAIYKRLLIETACRIDDDVIMKQIVLSDAHKLYILGHKYGTSPKQVSKCGDIELRYGDFVVGCVSTMDTVLDFLTIDRERRMVEIEGYHLFYGMERIPVEPLLIVNGQIVPCQTCERSSNMPLFLGERLAWAVGFKADVPLPDEKLRLQPAVKLQNLLIGRKQLAFGDFFPVSNTYAHSYALMDGCTVTLGDVGVDIDPKMGLLNGATREIVLLWEIWKKNLLGGRKAVFGRIYYHLVKPFKRRQLWLVSDRVNKAGDNAEAIYRYMTQHRPKDTRIMFAVKRDCPDYGELSQLGECVDAASFRYKLLFLLCDICVSSHADMNPFIGYNDALRDLLCHQKLVFLQHGVTKDDLSEWLNRYKQNFTGFVTSAQPEARSILEGDYGYTEDEIWLTGLPRFDGLYDKAEKRVTIMPTWRHYLMGHRDAKTGIWALNEGFEQQPYYRFYNALINSERLIEAIGRLGYTLQFFPHPDMQPYMDRFHCDQRVAFLPPGTKYREVYAESSLVVTDYSSAVFDFAYLRKPILYCQFDRDQFFNGSHVYTRGYFDYERDGFGRVTYDLEDTIDAIIEDVEKGCRLEEQYRERIDTFFAFNDKNNCRRVMERIMRLYEAK